MSSDARMFCFSLRSALELVCVQAFIYTAPFFDTLFDGGFIKYMERRHFCLLPETYLRPRPSLMPHSPREEPPAVRQGRVLVGCMCRAHFIAAPLVPLNLPGNRGTYNGVRAFKRALQHRLEHFHCNKT